MVGTSVSTEDIIENYTQLNKVNRIMDAIKGDRAIWSIAFLLGCASILSVYSAAGAMAFKSLGGNTEIILLKQIVFIGVGFFLMYVFYRFNYIQLSRLGRVMLILAAVLMTYTTFFAPEINDARRWITIPWINQTLQSSDFARIALIIYVARSLAVRQEYIKEWKNVLVPIILPIVLICGLIMPSDLSTAVLLFLTTFGMMFIGRVSMKFVAILLISGLILVMLVFLVGSAFPDLFRVDTWIVRVQDYLAMDDGSYQVQQSKIAIANGEWTGMLPGNSIQKNHLPYAYADFIYAIICEEYGLIGGVVILGIYLLLLFRCICIVTRCPKAFGAILAMGLCLNIVIQAFANIAVSVQLVPVTGLTLPMVSMGGTSMIISCISIGIILSVSKNVEKAEEQKVALEKIESADEGSN